MRGRLQTAGGFTIVELMIVIMLMALLLGLAVPSFKDASLASQLRATANELVAGATLARSEAIKRNATVRMCVSTNGTTCGTGSWEQGWAVIRGGTSIYRGYAAPTGFKIVEAGGLTTLNFQAIGAGATSATFTVCRATPSVGSQERIVTIDATGRPSVHTTNSGACP